MVRSVPQRPTRLDIAGPLTWEEFEDAVRGLNNHTAPGLNGITSEQIKALNREHKEVLFLILKEYFEDRRDIPEWHWGNFRVLPKHGDLTSPHKWRGINLLDTASKIMSAIVTKRLQKVLTDEGYNHQFGSTPRTGCPDANFTLKSILQLRREMGEDSWVAFLDLVKAFDTANHSLLLQLLRRYGIPENLVQVVRKLYTDFKMELKIGSEKTIIDYLTE